MRQTSSTNSRRSKPKSGGNGTPRPQGQRNRSRPSGGSRPASSGQKPSTLNPQLLIRRAGTEIHKDFVADRTFDEMPIDPKLKGAIAEKGFERPTEIQDRTLEALLDGKDLLGIAQTGTGKTGAFLIPIIDELIYQPQRNFALVVAPTRELATQIQDEFTSLTKGLRLYSSVFIGGTNINKDLQECRRSSDIIVATPGRLLDLVTRKALNLADFNTLVLDEFDRMLDMGFINDVKRIIHGMHNRKHTMLFSATLDKTQQKLIDEILHEPVTVKISSGDSTGDHIDQDIIKVSSQDEKYNILVEMLSKEEYDKVLVFEETKHRVSRLCQKLNRSGIKSDQIHGNKSQNARQRALNSFKDGSITVLVATDVAARGIDVSDVTHVINYQVPKTMDSYIHRIGRTGRAGKAGKAFTFVGA